MRGSWTGVLEVIRYWILRKQSGLEVIGSVHPVDGYFCGVVIHEAGKLRPSGLGGGVRGGRLRGVEISV